MKITVSELRKIIRGTLREQGWVPGRWIPTTGEPLGDEELDALAAGGYDVDVDVDMEDEYEDETDPTSFPR